MEFGHKIEQLWVAPKSRTATVSQMMYHHGSARFIKEFHDDDDDDDVILLTQSHL